MTNPSEDPWGLEGHIDHLNNAPHVGSSAKGRQSQGGGEGTFRHEKDIWCFFHLHVRRHETSRHQEAKGNMSSNNTYCKFYQLPYF